MTNGVSSQLHALVHHVELSKAGWRDRALELIVIRAVDTAPGPCERGAVAGRVNELIAAPHGRAQVESVVDSLLSAGKLVETAKGCIQLSEGTRNALHEQLQLATRREEAVAATFADKFAEIEEPGFDWPDFREELLYPLVSELGARAYELLSGEEVDVASASAFVRFLDRVPEDLKARVSDRIADFLDAGNPEVRGYILRLLNAAFLVQATHLSDEALALITARTGKTLRLRILVDTNFLFSLIGLHDNPADDVVDALHGLITGLKDRIDVQLYVLPITLDEARRTIAGYESRLSGFYLSKNISMAVQQGTQDLSGITLKYIQEGIRAGGKRLSAKEYFGPYHENLLTIARSKGVELYNQNTDPLRTAQPVLDDIVDQQAFEERTRPEHRRKSYEKILHDMVIWHFAREKRPAAIESPLDAEFWVATIDFGMLGFDRHKRRGRAEPPVCIHPTVLLQLLQLWVPRTEALEAALVQSLQPLVPHHFDRQAEEVTIRILRSLGRLEGSEDLGTETVTNILLDDAVRSRVGATESVEQQIEIVNSALADQNRLLDLKAKQLQKEAEGLRKTVKQQSQEAAALRDEVDLQKRTHSEVEADLTREREARERMEARVNRLERRGQVTRAVAVVVAVALVGGLVLGGSAWAFLASQEVSRVGRIVLSAFLAIAGLLGGASISARLQRSSLAGEEWVKWLNRAALGYWGTLVLGLIMEIFNGFLSSIWS